MDLKNIAKQIRMATIKMTVSSIVSVLSNINVYRRFQRGCLKNESQYKEMEMQER